MQLKSYTIYLEQGHECIRLILEPLNYSRNRVFV
jgi:hypothetical protein